MRNRTIRWVILGVALVLVVGGAFTILQASEPPAFPERPSPLTSNAAVDYAQEYERAVEHRNLDDGFGTDVKLTCGATLDQETADGFYVVAGCGGSVHHLGGSVGSVSPRSLTYFIARNTTIRIDPVQAPFPDENRTYRTNENSTDTEAIRVEVLNFDDRRHVVTWNITYLGTNSSDPVATETYDLGAHEGVEQDKRRLSQGSYRLAVTLEDGTSATYHWNVSGSDEANANSVTVYVTPNGTLKVGQQPRIDV